MAAFDDLIPSGGAPTTPAPANAFADLIPAPSKGVLGHVDDAVRSLAQGATFGFADELAAAGNTLPIIGTGKSYEENLADEKARNAAIPAAVKIPGEVAGAVGSAVAAAPVTGAVSAATGLAKLPGLVRAILGGGAAGAAYGAGNAEPGLENRAAGAAEGAGVGAAAGGVIGGVVAPTVRALATGVRNALNPRAQAGIDLGRALIRDETTPAQFASDVADAQAVRPGVATAADALGENGRGLLERIAQTPGAGRTQVVPALTARQEQQATRLSMDLASLTGTRRSAIEATKETMAQRATDSAPIYKEAMDFNARDVPEIVQAFGKEVSTGYGKQIANSAEFRNALQTEYGIQDPTQAPLMQVIDAWKKAADDMVGSALRGGNKNAARVIGDMRDRVVGVVDQFNPKYAEARNAWSGPSQYLDAIQEGANLPSPKVGADEVKAALADMTDANREAYVTGALSALFRQMGNKPRMADLAGALDRPEMRAKIDALMPTPEARAQWNAALDFEIKSSAMTHRALGNSATPRRLAEQEQAQGLPTELVKLALHPSAILPAILAKKLGALSAGYRDTVRSRSDRVLADVLTNPQANQQDVAGVLNAAQRQLRPPFVPVGAPTNATTEAIEGQ